MLQILLLLVLRAFAETSCLQRKLDDRCQKARKCIGMSFARFDGQKWGCYEKVSKETSLSCIDDQAKMKVCYSGDPNTGSCDRAKVHKLLKTNKIKRMRKTCLVKISTTIAPTTSLATVPETGCLQKQLDQHCEALEGQLSTIKHVLTYLIRINSLIKFAPTLTVQYISMRVTMVLTGSAMLKHSLPTDRVQISTVFGSGLVISLQLTAFYELFRAPYLQSILYF